MPDTIEEEGEIATQQGQESPKQQRTPRGRKTQSVGGVTDQEILEILVELAQEAQMGSPQQPRRSSSQEVSLLDAGEDVQSDPSPAITPNIRAPTQGPCAHEEIPASSPPMSPLPRPHSDTLTAIPPAPQDSPSPNQDLGTTPTTLQPGHHSPPIEQQQNPPTAISPTIPLISTLNKITTTLPPPEHTLHSPNPLGTHSPITSDQFSSPTVVAPSSFPSSLTQEEIPASSPPMSPLPRPHSDTLTAIPPAPQDSPSPNQDLGTTPTTLQPGHHSPPIEQQQNPPTAISPTIPLISTLNKITTTLPPPEHTLHSPNPLGTHSPITSDQFSSPTVVAPSSFPSSLTQEEIPASSPPMSPLPRPHSDTLTAIPPAPQDSPSPNQDLGTTPTTLQPGHHSPPIEQQQNPPTAISPTIPLISTLNKITTTLPPPEHTLHSPNPLGTHSPITSDQFSSPTVVAPSSFPSSLTQEEIPASSPPMSPLPRPHSDTLTAIPPAPQDSPSPNQDLGTTPTTLQPGHHSPPIEQQQNPPTAISPTIPLISTLNKITTTLPPPEHTLHSPNPLGTHSPITSDQFSSPTVVAPSSFPSSLTQEEIPASSPPMSPLPRPHSDTLTAIPPAPQDSPSPNQDLGTTPTTLQPGHHSPPIEQQQNPPTAISPTIPLISTLNKITTTLPPPEHTLHSPNPLGTHSPITSDQFSSPTVVAPSSFPSSLTQEEIPASSPPMSPLPRPHSDTLTAIPPAPQDSPSPNQDLGTTPTTLQPGHHSPPIEQQQNPPTAISPTIPLISTLNKITTTLPPPEHTLHSPNPLGTHSPITSDQFSSPTVVAPSSFPSSLTQEEIPASSPPMSPLPRPHSDTLTAIPPAPQDSPSPNQDLGTTPTTLQPGHHSPPIEQQQNPPTAISPTIPLISTLNKITTTLPPPEHTLHSPNPLGTHSPITSDQFSSPTVVAPSSFPSSLTQEEIPASSPPMSPLPRPHSDTLTAIPPAPQDSPSPNQDLGTTPTTLQPGHHSPPIEQQQNPPTAISPTIPLISTLNKITTTLPPPEHTLHSPNPLGTHSPITSDQFSSPTVVAPSSFPSSLTQEEIPASSPPMSPLPRPHSDTLTAIPPAPQDSPSPNQDLGTTPTTLQPGHHSPPIEQQQNPPTAISPTIPLISTLNKITTTVSHLHPIA
ncbi:hypothetical protein PAMA_005598 [Pampus argenteus]